MYKFVDFYNLDSTESRNLQIFDFKGVYAGDDSMGRYVYSQTHSVDSAGYISIADIFTNGIYIVKDVK